MITHYVYLSSYNNRGDLVLEADRFEPAEQVQRYWHPIEDCTTRNEALAKAKEYVAVLETLEEPKDIYPRAVILNSLWQARIESN